jgi:predicted metal-dependent hydrolase
MMSNIEIVYKKVKNLKITLSKDGAIIVTVPPKYPIKKIHELVSEKQNWIKKHQAKLLNNRKYDYASKNLIDGDELYLMGRRFIVRNCISTNNLINDDRDELIFSLNQSVIDNVDFKQTLLLEFYRDRADVIFNNLVAKYLKITNQDIKSVSIKKVKTRWGSCNYRTKTINLNLELITRDVDAVEYVILHEIAHLTHPNHSKEFYNYIELYMPDWKTRERKLK